MVNKISSNARKADPDKYRGTAFVYGEIMFEPFGITLHKINELYGGLPPDGEGVFYDVRG